MKGKRPYGSKDDGPFRTGLPYLHMGRQREDRHKEAAIFPPGGDVAVSLAKKRRLG